MVGTNARDLIHRVGVAALQAHIGFGAHDEEGQIGRETVETIEIDIAAIQDIKGSGLGQDLISVGCQTLAGQ